MTETEQPKPPLPEHHDCDALLQFLTYIAAKSSDASWGVTLNVNGAIITGRLVNRERWMDAHVEMVERHTGQTESMAHELRSWLHEVTQDDPRDFHVENIGFVHLVDAQVVRGSRMLPHEPEGLWRIRN